MLSQFEFLWNWVTPSTVVLFLAACLGHTAMNVIGLNWFLGFPWPKWFSKIIRRTNTVTLLSGPLLLLWGFALGFAELPYFYGGTLLWAYLILCWIIGFVFAPISLLVYSFRKAPSALQSNHSEVIDVAEELGFKPIGHGKHRRLALLPGNQVFQVEFSEKHLQIPNLPKAWEGLTILHLTDLHFRGVPHKIFFQQIMDRCYQWNPDILALTGDIIDSKIHHRWVIPILGRLRWQIAAFAILGNHEWYYDPELVRRRLRRLNMQLLENTWKEMEIRGEPMIVVGHQGPWFQPIPDVSDCPPNAFRLCLSHTPDNIAWAKKNQMNLMLSGHNHGGQIRFPWIGSIYCPSRYSRWYDCGTFEEKPTILHVSRGVSGQYPVRYHCRPEVSLLVLHSWDSD